jgi:hypothetical protein
MPTFKRRNHYRQEVVECCDTCTHIGVVENKIVCEGSTLPNAVSTLSICDLYDPYYGQEDIPITVKMSKKERHYHKISVQCCGTCGYCYSNMLGDCACVAVRGTSIVDIDPISICDKYKHFKQ